MTDGRRRKRTLFCYWFVKAWAAVIAGRAKRAGLVSTNSIRGGANRRVLEPIAESGAIFEAWSDEPWTIDGAAVRVSLVCFVPSSVSPSASHLLPRGEKAMTGERDPSPLAGEGGPASAGPDE